MISRIVEDWLLHNYGSDPAIIKWLLSPTEFSVRVKLLNLSQQISRKNIAGLFCAFRYFFACPPIGCPLLHSCFFFFPALSSPFHLFHEVRGRGVVCVSLAHQLTGVRSHEVRAFRAKMSPWDSSNAMHNQPIRMQPPSGLWCSRCPKLNQCAGSVGIMRQFAWSSHPPWPCLNGIPCQEQRSVCSKHSAKPLPTQSFAAEMRRGSCWFSAVFPVLACFNPILQRGRKRSAKFWSGFWSCFGGRCKLLYIWIWCKRLCSLWQWWMTNGAQET